MQKVGLRELSISSAMALVAAVGFGLGCARFFMNSLDGQSILLDFSERWKLAFSCVVFSMSLTLVLLLHRRPRTPFRRLIRQPGVVAAYAQMIAVSVGCLCILPNLSVYSGEEAFPPAVVVILDPEMIGLAVGGAWMAQVLGGWWRPERSWIDRLGRALGFSWFAATVFALWI